MAEILSSYPHCLRPVRILLSLTTLGVVCADNEQGETEKRGAELTAQAGGVWPVSSMASEE